MEVTLGDAVKLAAVMVSVSGDARRVLDVCRYVNTCRKTSVAEDSCALLRGQELVQPAGKVAGVSKGGQGTHFNITKCPHRGVSPRPQLQHQHLVYATTLIGGGDPTREPTLADLNGALDSLVVSRVMVIEDGPAAHPKTC